MCVPGITLLQCNDILLLLFLISLCSNLSCTSFILNLFGFVLQESVEQNAESKDLKMRELQSAVKSKSEDVIKVCEAAGRPLEFNTKHIRK